MDHAREHTAAGVCARTIPAGETAGGYGRTVGRPRIYHEARVATAVRLSPELHTELQERAKAEGCSANELVVRALREFLRRRAKAGRRHP